MCLRLKQYSAWINALFILCLRQVGPWFYLTFKTSDFFPLSNIFMPRRRLSEVSQWFFYLCLIMNLFTSRWLRSLKLQMLMKKAQDHKNSFALVEWRKIISAKSKIKQFAVIFRIIVDATINYLFFLHLQMFKIFSMN